ncbi:hypothetical protein SAMN04487969_14326, partial [Paenibacillus algorifonticola]
MILRKKEQLAIATVLLSSVLTFGPISSVFAAPVTTSWDTDNVTITNNVGKADTVKVTGLTAGSTVNVYDKATGGKLIGTAKVPTGQTEVTVTIANFDVAGRKVYISVVAESTASEFTVEAEAKTDKADAADVASVNNVGKADTLTVKAAVGTIIKVYDSETAGKILGTATVAAGKTEAIVSIAQIGAAETKVYVSATEAGKLESDRLEVTVAAEAK